MTFFHGPFIFSKAVQLDRAVENVLELLGAPSGKPGIYI